MDNPAYNLERMKNSEVKLLDKARPIEGRDQIKKFLEEKVTLANLSIHRFYYYSVRLRKSLEILADAFLDPTEDQIKSFMTTLIGKVSERTVGDYVDSYRRFQSWYHKGKIPKKFSILRFHAKKNGKKPEDLIMPDEFQKMVDNASSTRDKALISLLYDSGCRIGEILGMRKKDAEFDEHGMTIAVSGKTGYRKVYVIGTSNMFLKLWLQNHPSQNPETFMFTKMNKSQVRKKSVGDPMDYSDARSMLQNTVRKAGIAKRIHPHLFRHSRASVLATQITEAPMEAQMGWIHGSRQAATYVHLSGEQQRTAILKAYGIQTDTAKVDTGLMDCPACGNKVSVKAMYCPFCYTDFQEKRSIPQSREGFLYYIGKMEAGMKALDSMEARLKEATEQLEQSTRIIEDLQKENSLLKGRKPAH
jgi:integrase